MRIVVAGVTRNIGGATHTPLRPTRRERRTGFSLEERARLAKRNTPGLSQLPGGVSHLVSVAVVMTVAVLVLVGWLLDDRGLGR
jgi:hypothetical protein